MQSLIWIYKFIRISILILIIFLIFRHFNWRVDQVSLINYWLINKFIIEHLWWLIIICGKLVEIWIKFFRISVFILFRPICIYYIWLRLHFECFPLWYLVSICYLLKWILNLFQIQYHTVSNFNQVVFVFIIVIYLFTFIILCFCVHCILFFASIIYIF